MKKEKHGFKEELRNELEELKLNSKHSKDDLELGQNIDDRYTSSVFSRLKNEEFENKWFKASGIISILIGILTIIIVLSIALDFAFSSIENNASKREPILICTIIFTIIGIISIVIGKKIFNLSKLNKEKLIDNLKKVCFLCVFQFLFSGFIFVILTVIGYFVGIAEDYGVIYYNRIDNYETVEKSLKDSKIYYQSEINDDK